MVGHIPSQRVDGLWSVTGIEMPSTQCFYSARFGHCPRMVGRSFGGRNSTLVADVF